MRVSFIVPTLNRACLLTALRSIELWKDDELIVVGNVPERTEGRVRYVPHKPGGDWGHTERNTVLQSAMPRGDYIAHLDDDDTYALGTRRCMEVAMESAGGRPILFRMQFPNGITLWNEPRIFCGNVGTPMFLHPNEPDKFGTWGSFIGGDCHFLETSKWALDDYVWRPEIIAYLGHNAGEANPFA